MVKLNPDATKQFQELITQKERITHKEHKAYKEQLPPTENKEQKERQSPVKFKGRKERQESALVQIRWRIPLYLLKKIKLKAVGEDKPITEIVVDVLNKGLNPQQP